MRFRSVHTQLRNRLAYMTTGGHSPSGHFCQIVPVNALPTSNHANSPETLVLGSSSWVTARRLPICATLAG
jgi:hypothetical protein